jgi:hypothetical protein
MKTVKVSLVALVLAIGLGGAVAEKIHAAPSRLDQLYNWTHYDRSGNVIGTENNKSESQAESDFQCSSNGPKCAVGTATGKPSVQIDYTP